jgi:hypothetical protein
MAVGADEAMQLVLDHERHNLWDVDYLVAQRLGIIATERLTATPAVAGVMGDHLLALLRGEKSRARTGMALLATALAAIALAPLGWLKTRAVAGGRFGGVAGAAADPLSQAGQFSRQGGELDAELLNLLLLLLALTDQLKKSGPHAYRCGDPVRF